MGSSVIVSGEIVLREETPTQYRGHVTIWQNVRNKRVFKEGPIWGVATEAGR